MGTRDANLVPETTRLMGVVLDADGESLTVFLPDATGKRALANLKDNGHVAITCSHPANHLSFQLKGEVTSIRRAKGRERGVVDRYRADLAHRLGEVGVSLEVSSRLSGWPAHAVRVRVREVFEQTPGPGAGERFQGGAAAQ